MILLTVLEKEHLLYILKECKSFSEDQYDGWAIVDACEGGIEILELLEDTEVEIPDG